MKELQADAQRDQAFEEEASIGYPSRISGSLFGVEATPLRSTGSGPALPRLKRLSSAKPNRTY